MPTMIHVGPAFIEEKVLGYVLSKLGFHGDNLLFGEDRVPNSIGIGLPTTSLAEGQFKRLFLLL